MERFWKFTPEQLNGIPDNGFKKELIPIVVKRGKVVVDPVIKRWMEEWRTTIKKRGYDVKRPKK